MAAYRLCKHISGLYLPQLNLSQEMTFTLMKFDGIRKRICSLILHNAISCSDQRAFKSHQSRSATLTGGFCIPYHKLSAIYLMELTRKKLQSSAGKKNCLFCVTALQRKSFVQMFPVFTYTVTISASLAITVGINTSCSCKKHSWGLYLHSKQNSTSQLICC